MQSNIDGLNARITGSNVIVSILLISGIFTEVLAIRWLLVRRREHSAPKEEVQKKTNGDLSTRIEL
jgi:hypothetical protein